MITILTTTGAYSVEQATHWARGPKGDVHIYDDSPDGIDGSLATFDSDAVVAVVDELPDADHRTLADAHDPHPAAATQSVDELLRTGDTDPNHDDET